MSASTKEILYEGWLHKHHLLSKFNLGFRTLDKWVTEGFVRSAKLDSSQQGRRLYSVADVNATLAALAAGRPPKRHAGRG